MKKHLTKRILALLLTLAMVLSLMPMVFAEEPAAEEYVLATALSAGDKVVIYHPASGMAMSTALRNTYYREAVSVDVADDAITDPDAALVWTVQEAEGGFKLLDAEGHCLSMQGTYNSIPNDQEHNVWTLRDGAQENTVNITNVLAPAGSQGDPKAIEYYNNQFTGYYLGTSDAFQLKLFVLKAGDDPVDPPVEQDLVGKTVILHTNDTHGALLGFAQVAKVKADFEARGAEVILVDAGDFSQGTTYVSTNKGEAAITVMKAAGYDYITLGNHEFDFGYANLMANLNQAEGQIVALCADVFEGENTILPAYAIKEVDGVKIGFFGMETPETQTKVNPGLITELTFGTNENGKFLSSAQDAVAALKAEGADIIIGLVHLGVDDESEPYRSIDLFAQLEGVDFLIDGHSHTVMTEGPNGEPIQSTGTKVSKTALANVGLIQIDNATKTIEKHELIPLGQDAPVDEEVAAVAQAIMDAVDAEYGAVFATSAVELNGDKAPGNRNMETNLGDLITDAMLWGVMKDMDEETLGVPAENVVAITNGGGIRAWIHAGDVTMNDINTVLPFGNTVAVVYVTGAELLEALEASTYCTPGAVGGFPQVSGMKYNIDTAKDFDQGDIYPGSTYHQPNSIRRVTVEEINGKPFDPEATYAVVTNNFCAAGGDTYYVFKNASAQFDTGIPMDVMLMEFIKDPTFMNGYISDYYAEPQGRITQVPTDFVLCGWINGAACSDEDDWNNPSPYVFDENGKLTVTFTEDSYVWVKYADNSAGFKTNGYVENETSAVLYNYNAFSSEEIAFNKMKVPGNSEVTFTLVRNGDNTLTLSYTAEEITGELAGKTVILHTNDTHGAIMGFAQVAKVKADYEALGAKVILVDAGDFSQGTTYVSTNKGAAAVTMMNAAGYDVATLGNHEFDFGYTQLMRNFETAEFMPICADVYNKETGDPILPAYFIKEVDGVKIGFFGMETPETQTKVNPGLITELEFGTNENGKFLSGAQHAIAALKIEGADLIIGIVHLGVDDESEPYRSVDLYAAIGEDVDFLIDGHSHTVMTEGPNGEPIQSTGTKASKTAFMNVGLIQIDNATKTIEKNELIPLGEEAPVDETVAAIAQAIMDEVDAEYGAVFATSQVELNGDKAPGNRNMETNLGDLITDALLWSVLKDMDAETLGVPEANVVAITNGGGIRAWIHAGDVTMNDVNTVLPFGNTVAVVYVTGAELLEALEASTYCTPGAVGGFPQVSGMKYTINTRKAFDQGEQYPDSTYYGPNSVVRVTIDEVNGQPFDAAATYAVVTNNFCAAGGDTYYVFKNASSQFDTGLPMDEVLIDYITTELNGVIGEAYAEPQGRITIKTLFDDVSDPSKYYFEPVYWAVDHDPPITGGVGNNLFGPSKTCTREQVVTFLWAAAGKPAPESSENPFTDVKEGKYYYDAVLWAVEQGITSGMTADTFGVGKSCTRAQVVTFLWAAAGKPEPKSTDNPFTDVKDDAWYAKSVLWAVENKITSGTSATTFGPNKTCTRAQIVTFLYAANTKDMVGKTVILHTNDTHGALMGFAQVAALKKEYEKRGADVLLVDAGDYSQGTIYVSTNKGEAAVTMLNAAGYDFVTLGNHEFDYGYAQLMANMEKAEFQPIVADVILKETGKSIFDGHVIQEVGGVRIGFFGMETPETLTKVNPGLIQEITFPQGQEMYNCAQDEVDALINEEADIVIGLVHLGVDGESEPNRSVDLYNHVQDIDFLIDGHSHTVMTEGPNGEPIQSTGTKASDTSLMNVGFIQIDNETKTIEKNELIPLSANSPKDEAVAAAAQEIMDAVDAEYNQKFAESLVELNGDKAPNGNRDSETNMGDLITDAMLWGVSRNGGLDVDADHVVAITNGGGIRAWIHVGDVTKKDVNTVLPFGNTVTVVYISGIELLEALEASTCAVPGPIGGFPQIAGMKITVDSTKEYDRGEQYPDSTYYGPASIQRVTIDEINGQPFDITATYAVVTNNFCSAGGDTYYVFKNASAMVDTSVPLDEMLMDYITEELNGVIGEDYAEPQGRITILEEAEEDIIIGGLEPNIWTTKYGNIYTNCTAAKLEELGFEYGDILTVKFLDQELELPLVPTFSYVDQGSPACFINKNAETGKPEGYLFFAINMGNFAATYGIADKHTDDNGNWYWVAREGVTFPIVVTLEMKEKEGYLDEMLLHDINRTNNREDYPELTDEEFANFRQITTTGMGDHLFRGSSPINPEIGRNTYADAAIENAGVTVIMNLANNQAEAEGYEGYADTYYSQQNIIFLNLGVDFQGEDFQAGLANGLRFFAENKGVYYVHCTEGKDRAGFVSALLECLMGATCDEVVADYLKTYTNYYTVVDGVQQPLSEETLNAIASSNIIKTLKTAFGVEDLTTADLAAEAEEYIAAIGLTAEEIAALKENLAGTFEPPVEPEYYLVGTITDPAWTTLDEAFKFTKDAEEEGKYVLENVELPAGAAVKVKDGTQDGDHGWFPDGMNNEFVVENAGTYNVTFYPAGGQEGFHEGFFKVEEAPEEGNKYEVLPDGTNMLKYGHIDLDISVADFLEDFALGDIVSVEVNGYTFDAPVVTNYDDVDTGEYLIRCAAGKTVTTLAINYGQIGVAAGIIELAPEGSNPKYQLVEGLEWPMYATITMKEAGGYADELSIRKLTRTNVRSDYDDLTDAEFANFRVVGTTGMGENALYRTSSPIDPDLGRNTYADAAARDAGVKTFINLADTQEEAEAFEGYASTYYSTQTKLFLGLPVAFTSDEFKAGLADGYRFITTNDGPYLIHCLEGKDRTGLSVGVLECLMGATLEEIQADYLKTYENYFEIQNNEHIALTEAQVAYLKGIITKNLGIIFDVEDMTAANLAEEAEAYLTEIGLTDDEIAVLKVNLGKAWPVEEPSVEADFVLCGWINGAACSDEDDWENPSPYVFDEDGKLTVVFTEDSYIWIKLSDNSKGYKTDGLVENVTTATFYNYSVYSISDNKMKVPAGELTFTLVDNGDETLTLSYTVAGGSEEPSDCFVPAESVEDGDQILYVVAYNDKYYAMTNDTSINNALGAAEVTLNADGNIEAAPEGATWTLATGTATGSFTVKDEDGKFITYSSGTTLKLADAGVDFNVTCGSGSAAIKPVADSTRQIFLRDNNGALQFRCYAGTNATSSGYCAVLTIFKYVP